MPNFSLTENGGKEADSVLRALSKTPRRSLLPGVTRPPGASKSTFVDRLVEGIEEIRARLRGGEGDPIRLRRVKGVITELAKKNFDIRPGAIIKELNLRRPIYAKTACYGHFGRDDPDFTWERTNKAETLRKEAGL